MIVPALHIPDGLLTLPVSAAGWAVALPALALALRLTRGELGERQSPRLGVLAAFVFAAQVLQFPVPGGTTGHFVGAALASILVGPWATLLILAAVLGMQALLFQDGGLLALGWNLVNMGVVCGFTAHGLYRLGSRWSPPAAAFAAAWIGTQLGAVAMCLEVAASGGTTLSVAVPAMLLAQGLVGLGEGALTAGAVGFLARCRPALLARA